MLNVFLHGSLAQFGHKWQLEVESPAEAVHAIMANTKGAFRKHIIEQGLDKEYVVFVGSKDIPKEYLCDKTTEDIHIMPKIEGGKKELMIVIGVILIVVGAYFGQGWAVNLGISMVLSGIAQMLTPTPKVDKTRPSSTFSNLDRPINQGMPVPLAYGKIMVEGLPISISIIHRDTT